MAVLRLQAAGKGHLAMKHGITVQERLKDLRIERQLKLEELAAATGISKSALGSYENDDYKEINHGNLVALADFYRVSVDYLLCRTENRKAANTPLAELHISDEMAGLLKSGRINNRLLCEIATHEKFIRLMADAEIYVDGIAASRFRALNESLEAIRADIIRQYQPEAGDRTLETLEAAQIDEDGFFCHATHQAWDSILRGIRAAHEHDAESAPAESTAQDLMRIAKKALSQPGDYVDVYCHVMCGQLGIDYWKLPESDRKTFRSIMKKSAPLKNSPLANRKRRR